MTEYVVTVNRAISTEQKRRIVEAIMAVDDTEPVVVPGSGGVGPDGIEYADIAKGPSITVRVVE